MGWQSEGLPKNSGGWKLGTLLIFDSNIIRGGAKTKNVAAEGTRAIRIATIMSGVTVDTQPELNSYINALARGPGWG